VVRCEYVQARDHLARARDLRDAAAGGEATPGAAALALALAGLALERGWYEPHASGAAGLGSVAQDLRAVAALLGQAPFLGGVRGARSLPWLRALSRAAAACRVLSFAAGEVLPPPPRTKWTRCVPHPVLIGLAASLTPY